MKQEDLPVEETNWKPVTSSSVPESSKPAQKPNPPEKENQKAAGQEPAPSKPPVPLVEKKPKRKALKVNLPKTAQDGEQIVDYSGLYKSFWEIFVGFVLDPKGADMAF